jgi:hypothetical protein
MSINPKITTDYLVNALGIAETHAKEIIKLKEAVKNHHMFSQIKHVEHLRVFMELHIFAVWDFMSLLKRLQCDLTGAKIPWTPSHDPIAARLINEIVLNEETDTGPDGASVCSHFSLYMEAMKEIGANDVPIKTLVGKIENNNRVLDYDSYIDFIPADALSFVKHTQSTSIFGSTEEVLGSFVLAREDIIPGMFQSLLQQQPWLKQKAPTLSYYCSRHIELDGEQHGPAAWQLVARRISANNTRTPFALAAISALKERLYLWDRVSKKIESMSAVAA